LEAKRSPQIWKVWREVKHHQSYAQAVKASTNTSQHVWKGISFDTAEVDINWLEGSYIGRVSDFSRVNITIEEVIQYGLGRLSAKYLGENAILIQGIEGVEIGNIIDENNEWWESVFDTITPWNSSQTVQNKLVWVRCRGLPFNLWSQQCFEKIVALTGELVSIDEKTLTWDNLEYARLNVKVPIGMKIWIQKSMRINGKIYNVILEEETNNGMQTTCCCANVNDSSSKYNSSCKGLFNFSSESERCDNDILNVVEKNKMKEDRTVQSPTTIINRSIQATSEMSSRIGNVSPNRCVLKAGKGRSEPKPNEVLPMPEPINNNSLINTFVKESAHRNPVTVDFGSTLEVAQYNAEGGTDIIVNETDLGLNGNVGPDYGNTGLSVVGVTKDNQSVRQSDHQPGSVMMGFDHQINKLGVRVQERGSHDVSYSFGKTIWHNANAADRSVNPSGSVIPSKDLARSEGHDRCETPVSKQMTLIKETTMDPKDFQNRRQFWIGESSMKRPISLNPSAKDKGKASKRKILKSVVQTICNSLFDDNIVNCNRLFWSKRCPLGDFDPVTIWSLAKELGVTFLDEEEHILKELEQMEERDTNHGKSKVGKNVVDNENH